MTTDQKPGEWSGTSNAAAKGKKLLERAWDALLAAGFADGMARQYVSWMRDYVLFHGKRHPQKMGVPEVRAFLADGRFSGQAAAQRVEATAAIRFLYEVVLERLQLAVRSGKGDQDRVTVLPRLLLDRLREQIERVRRLHEDDDDLLARHGRGHHGRAQSPGFVGRGKDTWSGVCGRKRK